MMWIRILWGFFHWTEDEACSLWSNGHVGYGPERSRPTPSQICDTWNVNPIGRDTPYWVVDMWVENPRGNWGEEHDMIDNHFEVILWDDCGCILLCAVHVFDCIFIRVVMFEDHCDWCPFPVVVEPPTTPRMGWLLTGIIYLIPLHYIYYKNRYRNRCWCKIPGWSSIRIQAVE